MLDIVIGTMTFGGQTDQDTATQMLAEFASSSSGRCRIDSARMYCGGETDKMLGRIFEEDKTLGDKFAASCKSNPFMGNSLSANSLTKQLDEELEFSQRQSADIFYLHGPDANTPIEETLKAVQDCHEAGKFKIFGLSNFTSWETVWIHSYMESKGWVVPSIYQGMYNALTRSVEEELFPALRRIGMKFFVYNPLMGGMLTGKHKREEKDTLAEGRFTSKTQWGKIYQDRFMKEVQFDAVDVIKRACDKHGISPAQASLRWLVHHSKVSTSQRGDAIIIGASSISHFRDNIASVREGKELPEEVVAAFSEGWELCKPVCPSYSRGYSGSALE